MTAFDWSAVRLVVFDVDGTLYNQRPVRISMARALALKTIAERSFETVRILKVYRELGERPELAPAEDYSFWRVEETARVCGCTTAHVRSIVEDWMFKKPLPTVAKNRVHGIQNVFETLKLLGKKIAVWSDYPSEHKLSALGLNADFQIWTGNDNCKMPKPYPDGLSHLMRASGCAPDETVMIGDRFDRDWAAANALRVATLMRSTKKDPRSLTFWNYTDPVFASLLVDR